MFFAVMEITHALMFMFKLAERRRIFHGHKSLQDLDQNVKNLELCQKPNFEKRGNNVINDLLSCGCNNLPGPKKELSAIDLEPSESIDSG